VGLGVNVILAAGAHCGRAATPTAIHAHNTPPPGPTLFVLYEMVAVPTQRGLQTRRKYWTSVLRRTSHANSSPRSSETSPSGRVWLLEHVAAASSELPSPGPSVERT
jgi:hypothetical protein